MSDDLVREFLVDSTENLDTLDRERVLLEKDPRDAKLLASVFRTIHTIKGTRFLGFHQAREGRSCGRKSPSQSS
jgi:two-component system, chemotaxis family, sensor kinase CheA